MFRSRYHHILSRLQPEENLSKDVRRDLEVSAMKMKRAAERRKMIVLTFHREDSMKDGKSFDIKD